MPEDNDPESHIPENQLAPPPMALNPDAIEVLRVWATPEGTQELTLRTAWEDPGAWGILLADIARHAVKAYGKDGFDEAVTMRRLLGLFSQELTGPTDEPREITGEEEGEGEAEADDESGKGDD